MLPESKHPADWHFKAARAAPLANFARGRSIYMADRDHYELRRSMLYALGARSVSNKMMAHVDTVLHGDTIPGPARTKYPNGSFVPVKDLLPLFHQEIDGFHAYVRALKEHGFRVRNPSDEGDPEFDHFSLPLVDGSLHATLLHYLSTSPFIRDFSLSQACERDDRDDSYVPFNLPNQVDNPWYILWQRCGWDRVHAQRGEGDHPLEIKGRELLAVAPVLWSRSAGLWFNHIPHVEAVNGLFIQAGLDTRTDNVDGVSISRVWT